MSIPFPSGEYFTSLQESLNSNPSCTEHLDPSEAYCGLAVGDHLFVLEFDGHECSAVVAGGNELDLDFVVAGPSPIWQQAIEGVEEKDALASLAALVDRGELEIRCAEESGVRIAKESLPMLQAFIDQTLGLDVEFE